MRKTCKGIDISHWNQVSSEDFSDLDFCFVKATEGKNVDDEKFNENLALAKKANPDIVLGAYHYARPEYNQSGKEEAWHFANVTRPYWSWTKEPMLLALDWEGDALKCDPAWALEWMKEVYNLTRIKPVIYTQASAALKMSFLFEEDFGLWVAHWNVKKPSHKGWPFWAFWQYTSRPIDKNYFNGSKEQLLKYATREG